MKLPSALCSLFAASPLLWTGAVETNVSFDPSTNELVVSLEKSLDGPDHNWEIVASNDLKKWSPSSELSVSTQPNGASTTTTFRHPIDETSDTLFLQLSQIKTQSKNVLLIMADDFNFWTGVDGYYPAARTPNIDRLARQGVFFNNAHSASPVCHPSRNALWSGVSPLSSGIDSNGQAFIREVSGFEAVVTLNQYFKQNGYYVYGGGKLWHPSRMDPSNSDVDPDNWSELNSGATGAQGGSYKRYQSQIRSLVSWSGNPDPMTESNTNDLRLAKDVARFIEQLAERDDQSQPFFIGCGFFRPHLPWNSPKEFWDLFDETGLPRPNGADIEADLPGAVDYFKELYDAGKWEEGLHAYLAACALADYNVGVLLDALDASPYADNTIVLFMGDHGWQLGEKGRWGKFSTWEAANHTTFIVYDPSAPGNGQICPEPVTLQDVYPTLVELTGLPVKTDIDGRSLLPLLEDPNRNNWNRPIVMQYSGTRYTQDKEWRFIEKGNDSQLYHLSSDPYEQTNLYNSGQYDEVIATLRSYIEDAVQLSQDIHSGARENPYAKTR